MSVQFDEQQQFVDSSGSPVVNGFIYIGIRNLDPVANPITIYSDRALTVVLANPQRTDANGRAVNKIWLSGRYSVKVEDVNNVQLYQELDNGEAEGSETTNLVNVLGSNAITADGSPTITSYADKAIFILQILLENTTDAVTINIDGLGVKTIERNFDQAIGKGKFKVNQTVMLVFNTQTDSFHWINENARVLFQTKGADIAAAATVDLSLATGNFLDITGAVGPITSFGTVIASVEMRLRFPGTTAITITSSSVANPTNILCAAAHGILSTEEIIISGLCDTEVFTENEAERFPYAWLIINN